MDTSLWTGDQDRNLQTMDISQTPAEYDTTSMKTRVNSLLEKSRNIYTEKQSLAPTSDSLPYVKHISKVEPSTKSGTTERRVSLDLTMTA